MKRMSVPDGTVFHMTQEDIDNGCSKPISAMLNRLFPMHNFHEGELCAQTFNTETGQGDFYIPFSPGVVLMELDPDYGHPWFTDPTNFVIHNGHLCLDWEANNSVSAASLLRLLQEVSPTHHVHFDYDGPNDSIQNTYVTTTTI